MYIAPYHLVGLFYRKPAATLLKHVLMKNREREPGLGGRRGMLVASGGSVDDFLKRPPSHPSP